MEVQILSLLICFYLLLLAISLVMAVQAYTELQELRKELGVDGSKYIKINHTYDYSKH